MISSGLVWLGKISNDIEHHAASLQQPSFLWNTSWSLLVVKVCHSTDRKYEPVLCPDRQHKSAMSTFWRNWVFDTQAFSYLFFLVLVLWPNGLFLWNKEYVHVYMHIYVCVCMYSQISIYWTPLIRHLIYIEQKSKSWQLTMIKYSN